MNVVFVVSYQHICQGAQDSGIFEIPGMFLTEDYKQ